MKETRERIEKNTMKNEKRHTVIFLAVSLLVVFLVQDIWGAPNEPPRPAGRISAIPSGSKVVQNSEGKSVIPKLFDMVYESDTLDVAKGSSVRILFYNTYEEKEIKGEVRVKITAKGCLLERGKGTITTTRKPPQTELAANPSGRGKEIAGVAWKAQKLQMPKNPLFPVANTMDEPARITITWKAPDGLQIPFYTITITDIDSNKKVVTEEIITSTSYTFPESLSPPKPGTHYSCVIKGYPMHPKEPGADFEAEKMAVTTPPYSFTVPSKQAVEFIKSEEKKNAMLDRKGDDWLSASLFLMSLYIEYGLDDRAARLAKELQKDKRVVVFFADSDYMKALINCFAK